MTAAFGTPHRHFRLTGSTNDEARALARAGAPSGTIVTAAEQDAGRGRHGRRWSAPRDSALLCSAILRPLGGGDALLPLAVPLAVCEAVESLGASQAAVKWPNDVWLCEPEAAPGEGEAVSLGSGPEAKSLPVGRKVAGILIEARPPEWAVIGAGINLSIAGDEFPADLRWPATSVGGSATPEQALRELNEALGRWVGAGASEVLAAFEERDALRGREVSWDGGGQPSRGSGVAAGIDDRGNLLVDIGANDPVALGAGEVSLRLADVD